MALSKNRKPTAIVVGNVIGVDPKQRYENNQPTGDVARFDVTLMQSNHATPDVRFMLGKDALRVPEVGESVALVVELGESREWGANFTAVAYVGDAHVEGLTAYLPVTSGK